MQEIIQMTLSLPTNLVDATEKLVKAGKAKTIDDFVVLAISHEILKFQNQSDNSQDLIQNIDAFDDPIWGLGENPVIGGVADASDKIDKYLYI